MPDHRKSRKLLEQDTVSVPVDHLLTVPECIVVVPPMMDGGNKLHSFTVQRIPPVDVRVKIKRIARAVVSLVYNRIFTGRVTFGADRRSRQRRL